MTCTKYDDFELGLVEAGEMRKHLETCPECRRQSALDERLKRATASLRGRVDDTGLWERIEAGLLEKGAVDKAEAGAAARAEGGESGPSLPISPGKRPFLNKKRLSRLLSKLTFASGPPAFARTAGVAALVVAAAGIAAWFLLLRPSPQGPSGLMAGAALARVETEEREYATAIEELAAKAGPKLAEMDFSLMALYRDRLETIDAQIERCREAIARNPWNAHIRRYMLAALQDKKDTLGSILSQ